MTLRLLAGTAVVLLTAWALHAWHGLELQVGVAGLLSLCVR